VPGTLDGDAADEAVIPPTPANPATPPAEEPQAGEPQAGEPQAGEPQAGEPQAGEPQPRGLAGITGGLLAGLAGQAAILTAVLVYFGWVRAYATYHYFGVDLSALDFSVSDYVLHSVNVAFPMVVVIALLALCAAYGHELVRPHLNDPNWVRLVVNRSARTGACLAAVGLILALVLAMIGRLAFLGLVLLVIGAALGMYAMVISSRYSPPKANAGFPSYIIASGALVLLLFMWTVTTYANYAGIQQAEQVQSGLPAAAEVIVYSSTNLSLSGPGITMSTVQAPDSEFRFRYNGLRFLVGSGGNDFLLPEHWRPGDGSVMVLPAAGPGILVEFAEPAP
jgi:hypothetical protein